MEHPSANIYITDDTKELYTTDLEAKFDKKVVRVRQVVVSVQLEQSHVKDGELLLSGEGTDFPRPVRYSWAKPVGWGAKVEPITLPEGIVTKDLIASKIHEKFSEKRTDLLKAGVGYFATLLFTIEGHENAYLTTEKIYTVPLGKAYILQIRLVGEGLSVPATESLYVELDD